MEHSSPLPLSRARPGGHPLRREVVVHHQRERILTAALALIAERGYRAVTVADIVKRAATARAKFYENFASKSDCFLAACDLALEQSLSRAGEALADAEDSHPARLSAAINALLDYLTERPEVARACLLEAPLLGPVLDESRERARTGFTALLRDARGEEDPSADALLAGLYWILYNALLGGSPADLRELAPELVSFASLPFAGPGGSQGEAR